MTSSENWDEQMPHILDVLRSATDDDFKKRDHEAHKIKDLLEDKLAKDAKKSKGALSKHLIDIISVCLDKKTVSHYKIIRRIAEAENVHWKKHVDSANEITLKFMEPIDHPDLESDDRKRKDFIESIDEASNRIMEGFEQHNILKKVSASICDLIEYCCRVDKDTHYPILYSTILKAKYQGHDKKVAAILDAFVNLISKDDFDIGEHSYTRKRTALVYVLEGTSRHAVESNTLHKHLEYFLKISEECFKHDLDEVGYMPYSFWGEVIRTIITQIVISSHGGKNKSKFIPYVLKLLQCDVEDLEEIAAMVFPALQVSPEVVSPFIDDIIDAFLNDRLSTLPGIKASFTSKEDIIMSRFDEIAEKCEEVPRNEKYAVMQLYSDVAKKYPQRLLPYKEQILDGLDEMSTQSFALMTLVSVIPADRDQFTDDELIDRILKATESLTSMVYYTDQAIAEIGKYNQEKAEKCMKIMADQLGNPTFKQEAMMIIMAMKQLAGSEYIPILAQYKDLILSFKDSTLPGMKEAIEGAIDLIEGRSLATVADQVEDIERDVEKLDERVTTTEDNVQQLNETVDEQQKDIKTIKEDTKEQGERLEQLEEVVDETVEKVEEIDHKTLSAAPVWSKDVSNILNVNTDYDWRFLAIRLGYGSEDIRNWATAHDPTMSLLSEWYTTHKGADATYAVLTSLKEMGRNDCVDIIENALKAADEMLPQAPPEFTHPPPVFISYQWDHQSEVKTLKEHLEKAGYDCWMDIGQMGGGDQLYQKIDEGLRGAKIVLSMVTNKYAKSKNCNHEVNLANLLNKPIIPLLIENVTWPPPGPMSVLFSQLLYIKFCTEKKHKKGQPFWPESSFDELLGQINIHVAPNNANVPIGKVAKNTDEEEQTTKLDQKEKTGDDPEVFISYQWDKQTQVKTLYSRLTSLGYNCWFDIMQMGGGDNLYSQIERGVRKAKVVISCCTRKYALSANCRREVSLSDALKKPLIPLVLESMTWPPEGPMALPFTQCSYIQFTGGKNGNEFDEPKFDELVQRLGNHVRPRHPEKRENPKTNDTVEESQASPTTGERTVQSPTFLTETSEEEVTTNGENSEQRPSVGSESKIPMQTDTGVSSTETKVLPEKKKEKGSHITNAEAAITTNKPVQTNMASKTESAPQQTDSHPQKKKKSSMCILL